jgi:hypothetical protein
MKNNNKIYNYEKKYPGFTDCFNHAVTMMKAQKQVEPTLMIVMEILIHGRK